MKSKLIMWDDVSLLDYIGDIENKYVPYIDYYEYKDNACFTIIPINEDTNQSEDSEDFKFISEEEIRLANTRPVETTQCKEIFSKRYNDNLISKKNLYDTYKKELGCLVEKLGLNVEKFWFLILFTFDYCESIFYQGETYKPTPIEQLFKLSNTIKQCSREESMTLKFKCGKKKAELDSQLAIAVLSSLIDDFNEQLNYEYSSEDEKTSTRAYKLRTLLNKRERKENVDIPKDSPIIVYFANMLLNFFDAQSQICSQRKDGAKHTKTEMELVSKLVFLMGLSTNKNWNDIECEYLKAFLKQYKDYKYPNNVSSVYPEFTVY